MGSSKLDYITLKRLGLFAILHLNALHGKPN